MWEAGKTGVGEGGGRGRKRGWGGGPGRAGRACGGFCACQRRGGGVESVSLEISSGWGQGICVARSTVPQIPGDFEFSLTDYAVRASDLAWLRISPQAGSGDLGWDSVNLR